MVIDRLALKEGVVLLPGLKIGTVYNSHNLGWSDTARKTYILALKSTGTAQDSRLLDNSSVGHFKHPKRNNSFCVCVFSNLLSVLHHQSLHASLD